MKKKIDWGLIKSDYEETTKSVRAIAVEHDISHTSIQKKIKSNKWNKFEEDKKLNVKLISNSGSISKVANRIIKEVVEFLGNNYHPSMEPLIIGYASKYEMVIELKNMLGLSGLINCTTKGTKQISVELRAFLEVEKSLRESASDLGISTATAKKIGLFEINTDGTDSSIFDLNKKRAELRVNV